jgi:hypothetical protein
VPFASNLNELAEIPSCGRKGHYQRGVDSGELKNAAPLLVFVFVSCKTPISTENGLTAANDILGIERTGTGVEGIKRGVGGNTSIELQWTLLGRHSNCDGIKHNQIWYFHLRILKVRFTVCSVEFHTKTNMKIKAETVDAM